MARHRLEVVTMEEFHLSTRGSEEVATAGNMRTCSDGHDTRDATQARAAAVMPMV